MQATIELAVSQTPSLILLDLTLPDMNGLDVLRALKENPKTLTIPVIMVDRPALPDGVTTASTVEDAERWVRSLGTSAG